MLWEAFLLFSPIWTSAGHIHGRRRAKRTNLGRLELAVCSDKAIEIGQLSVEGVADALDAIERDPRMAARRAMAAASMSTRAAL